MVHRQKLRPCISNHVQQLVWDRQVGSVAAVERTTAVNTPSDNAAKDRPQHQMCIQTLRRYSEQGGPLQQ